MKLKYILLASAFASSTLAVPAFAGTFDVTCTNTYSNESVTVKNVTADSQADAVKKVRNDPQYSELESCS
ncbi:MAG: hypothetical protein GXP05_03620 [Alphaproteobacteria bacterium]|nr:hypothetical protein [Alphaproteobacteria bacterium]